jgi:type I restriction enzyme M protein
MARFSSRARKIIEKFRFEEEIEKLDEANRLFEVVKQVAAVDLHPDTSRNIAMGYIFEDLVRRPCSRTLRRIERNYKRAPL